LLDILQKRGQVDALFLDSLSLLKRDSSWISAPRQEIQAHEALVQAHEIVESETSLSILLLKIADLPEVLDDYIAKELGRMYDEIQLLDNRSIVTGSQRLVALTLTASAGQGGL